MEEENIEIPGGQISGPDLTLDNRDFIVVLTINNFEKVPQTAIADPVTVLLPGLT